MRTSGRMKVYMSTGLAILLIAQLIIFLRAKPGLMFAAPVFIIIVMLAVVAVGFNYWNMKQVENRARNLPEDFRIFYVDANEAIGMSTMRREQKKAAIEMILEILEHAHRDGRSLEDVIGDNPGSYIDGFISATGGRLSPMYLFGYSLSLFVLYLMFIKFYKVFRDGSGTLEDLSTQPLDIGIVLVYVLIAFIFFPWLLLVMQKAASNQWKGLKRLWVLIPFSVPMLLMVSLIYIDTPAMRSFLDRPLPLFSNVWLIAFWTLIGGVGVILTRYARKRQIRRALDDM